MVYLRPETAQGIYVNYLNVLQSSRQRIPFGIAQIGKAFRNEITPGNFIFRTREFEQMEMQFFVKPGTDAEWFERWREWRMAVAPRARPHPGEAALAPARPGRAGPLRHARRSTSSTSSRSAGRRSRASTTAATSTSAATRSTPGKKLEYFDQAANERYLPYIVETSAGADRVTLTLLVDAYREEEVEGETRVVLGFHPGVAPIKAGVFPLVKKDGMPELATALYHDLKQRFPASTTTAAPSAGATAGWTRPARRSASRSTARPRRSGRDGPPPRLDAAGAGRPRPGGRLRRRSALGAGPDRACGSPTSSHGAPHGRTRCRREFLDGVAEIVVSPRTLPHPERPGIFTLGECIPLPAAAGGAGAEASRAGSCCTTARSRRSPGSTPGFDWRDEAWETLTHELRHHLEWRARAPDLEAFDWAVEQNFARQDGEAFDPAFYLAGAPVADELWRVEDDVFVDRIVSDAARRPRRCTGRGRDYAVPVPARRQPAGLPHPRGRRRPACGRAGAGAPAKARPARAAPPDAASTRPRCARRARRVIFPPAPDGGPIDGPTQASTGTGNRASNAWSTRWSRRWTAPRCFAAPSGSSPSGCRCRPPSPRRRGPAFLTLRGQGGEEIAIAVAPAPGGTRVRASTLLFDQARGPLPLDAARLRRRRPHDRRRCRSGSWCRTRGTRSSSSCPRRRRSPSSSARRSRPPASPAIRPGIVLKFRGAELQDESRSWPRPGWCPTAR